MRFKEKLIGFMYGRYGFDKMGQILLWTGVVLSLLNTFVGSILLTLLAYIILVYCVFRAMSKNIYKRRTENEKFMKIWGKFSGFFKLQKNKFRDRKTHVYRKCPNCHATLRLPKAKGKHTVKCPKCFNRFETKG